jgi:hypothetical protein
MENSIANYKILKKQYIDDIFKNEINRETSVIEKKENELVFLKKCHEKKLRNKSLGSTMMMYPTKSEKITINDRNIKNEYY